MITAATKERVLGALRQVMDPELGRGLVDLGMVRDVNVENGAVRLTLAMTTMACPLRAQLAAAARAAVAALPGVEDVQVETVEMTEEEKLRVMRQMLAAAAGRVGSGVWSS